MPIKNNRDALMKKNMQIALCCLVLCIFCNYVYAKPLAAVKIPKGDARITALEGSSQAKCSGQKHARSLKVADILQAGCEVSTGENSRLELILPDNSIIRFAENTSFKLLQADVGTAGQRDVKIFISLGKIWSNVRKALGGKGGFEVSCENAVAGVRGTIYRVNVEDDKSALVKVYDGEVSVAAPINNREQGTPVAGPPQPVPGPRKVAGPKQVSMEEWIYIIKSMQQIRIKADGSAEEPKDFTEAEDRDDWVDWNKSRDNK
jgi:ferric-dicitrate binding protein FerR (iron transport regulator)